MNLRDAARVLRFVAGRIEFRSLAVRRGRCPLCQGSVFVRFAAGAVGARCLSCRASVISMGIGTVLVRELPTLGRLRVCELSSRGPVVAFLARQVAGSGELVCSEFFDDVAPGAVQDGIVCQDVQRLTYPDARFDVCSCTEVFEHVPDDRRGFAEVHRVLVPGGRFIFTVPLADRERTLERVRIEGGEVRHVHPPAYHDDVIRGHGRVLVYRDYGRDITERLVSAGFAEARIETVPDPAGFGCVARVIVARKA